MKTIYPAIGSVSEGTLRTEDLLNAFAFELRYQMRQLRLSRADRTRFAALLKEADAANGNGEFDDDLLSDLRDALEGIAAPYSYFGAADGDGACFGFWPIIDDDLLPRLVDGDTIPREHWGEDVYLINDHGNVTCVHISRRGRVSTVYWATV